jgi:2-dehydro-3-deoxygluconokinase
MGARRGVQRRPRVAALLRPADRQFTALADNDIGWLIEALIPQGGVDTSLVQVVPYDGVGRTVSDGLNGALVMTTRADPWPARHIGTSHPSGTRR